MVFRFERHQDICVACSDEAGCGVHVIDSAVGQTDVVQNIVHFLIGNFSPDEALDDVANLRSLLDARAALGAKMEDKLTVVAAREEIPAKKRHQEKYRETGKEKAGDKNCSPVHKHRQQAAVAIPHPLKCPLEGPLELHQGIP